MIFRSASLSLASLKAVTTKSPRIKFLRVCASLLCSEVRVSEVIDTMSLTSLDTMLEHYKSHRHRSGHKNALF